MNFHNLLWTHLDFSLFFVFSFSQEGLNLGTLQITLVSEEMHPSSGLFHWGFCWHGTCSPALGWLALFIPDVSALQEPSQHPVPFSIPSGKATPVPFHYPSPGHKALIGPLPCPLTPALLQSLLLCLQPSWVTARLLPPTVSDAKSEMRPFWPWWLTIYHLRFPLFQS